MKKRPYARTDRVGQNIRRELSAILMSDLLHDPDILPVSVVHVGMSKDLRTANVHVQILRESDSPKTVIDALYRGAGYLRRQLRPRLTSRYIPNLRFHLDDSLDALANLGNILSDVESDTSDDFEA